MTREEKSVVIEELTAQLADNTNIYLTDISGLDAATTSNLRRACFKSNIKLANQNACEFWRGDLFCMFLSCMCMS